MTDKERKRREERVHQAFLRSPLVQDVAHALAAYSSRSCAPGPSKPATVTVKPIGGTPIVFSFRYPISVNRAHRELRARGINGYSNGVYPRLLMSYEDSSLTALSTGRQYRCW